MIEERERKRNEKRKQSPQKKLSGKARPTRPIPFDLSLGERNIVLVVCIVTGVAPSGCSNLILFYSKVVLSFNLFS